MTAYRRRSRPTLAQRGAKHSAARRDRSLGDAPSALDLACCGFRPMHFWRMTPRELAFAIEAVTKRDLGEPLERVALFADMMERFPDFFCRL